ncbi:AraC-type DNA-binding protein [Mucilaginibacter lappiensis]|uniref:AraC-like DNA-binding protein n=1 Tax=Mucilaginibacter lappiensis TaxID=354630 RepID=A0ABR6PDS6_9SPHI|nr:AraC family transcriptional regulator [Mucilaginibacter lappiensis]MBB6107856.1 AraC-like DNA-binding protein [Mucilaginibacter lappiensis]SIP94804.1 AraC-type DNA-binding protein [Mucilaginibacter lappiensis]
MFFEFTVQPGFNFVKSFGEKFNIPVFKNSLKIPDDLGEGYIKMIDIEPGFKLVLHHYTLKQDFHLKRHSPEESTEVISIVFNSNETPTGLAADRENAIQFLKNNGSSIQIASTALGTETFFPAYSEVYFGVIGIRRQVLLSLLRIDQVSGPLETILFGNTMFFYHEKMNPEVQRILKQISEINDQNKLSDLYYGIKAHELIYLLFDKLLDRGIEKQSPVNKADIDKLYVIRTAVLADLSQPPQLNALAKFAGMSETKMKQLFKQTFGDTIYNYYQNERMQEAGFLLKHAGYSVSETGYRLGFSNLSHFARLFEKHYGITPKKYTAVG